MRVLVVAAHGSRLPSSNDEIRKLAAELAPAVSDRYQRVDAAFLELAEPSIGAAIDGAVSAGATEVVVLPYFLAAGRHVADDIPAIVSGRQTMHPSVRIEVAQYLGARPEMLEVLSRSV